MIRFCSLLLLLASPAVADLRGTISVVDGDTIHVGSATVRLHGIDAPEQDQTCEDRQGRTWPCGAFVSERVSLRYDGERAICNVVDVDQYGRNVAKCYVDQRDIADDIVAEGWAEAYRRYSMDYDLTEKGAQVRGVGIWSGTMQSPSAFRAEQRGQTTSGRCIIKGNISASGMIYHMPHNRDYAATRINEARGERWFCSEAEARAAGWRAARN
ncbi:thermonuclease family protein [Pseudooctadecabacter sp.]|uniref:thermonuclease family protein n=1 Tax=Pseudooctadecabacter sp. TaxID=1966338 RepID=UPI0025F69079|nr:thermonuclease family protein [Pseudooctadecabacter sp.]